MISNFLFNALLAGVSIAIVAGPLGSLVLWQRMAYFGDTLSHTTLLGVTLGLMLNINLNVAIILCCIIVSLFLVLIKKNNTIITNDTLLGILAHSALSIGLVTLSFMKEIRIDILSYFFGDLLAINNFELLLIVLGSALILLVINVLWSSFIAVTVHEELAIVEGIPVYAIHIAFSVIISIVIATAMKIVGILLVTALLIIPAATAQQYARSPEQMAVFASVLGILEVCLGLLLSWVKDTPVGPSIVVTSTIFFMFSFILKLIKK